MIALLFLSMQVAQPEAVPVPPTDWSGLPVLRYRKSPEQGAGLSAFVRDQVKAGLCARAMRTAQGWTLKIDLAVLGTAGGQVRRIVPQAIGCPSVEQYAVGLMSSMTRDNVQPNDLAETWYRTSMTFAWSA